MSVLALLKVDASNHFRSVKRVASDSERLRFSVAAGVVFLLFDALRGLQTPQGA